MRPARAKKGDDIRATAVNEALFFHRQIVMLLSNFCLPFVDIMQGYLWCGGVCAQRPARAGVYLLGGGSGGSKVRHGGRWVFVEGE